MNSTSIELQDTGPIRAVYKKQKAKCEPPLLFEATLPVDSLLSVLRFGNNWCAYDTVTYFVIQYFPDVIDGIYFPVEPQNGYLKFESKALPLRQPHTSYRRAVQGELPHTCYRRSILGQLPHTCYRRSIRGQLPHTCYRCAIRATPPNSTHKTSEEFTPQKCITRDEVKLQAFLSLVLNGDETVSHTDKNKFFLVHAVKA